MRKNALIARLHTLKGNPEILLWNGTVGDYQHIKEFAYGDLVKQTQEDFLLRCELEKCRDEKNPEAKLTQQELADCKAVWRSMPYETNRYVTQKHIKERRYRAKTVIFVVARVRGKSDFDRYNSIEY